MKTILLFALTSLICLGSFAQNNPPVAVDDYYTQINRWNKQTSSISFLLKPLQNDSDPDNDSIFIDTAYTYSSNIKITYAGGQNLVLSFLKLSPGIYYDTIFYKVCDNNSNQLCSWSRVILYRELTNYRLYIVSDSIVNSNIKARVNSFGAVFNNRHNNGSAYNFPKNSKQTTIYAFNTWLLGKVMLNKLSGMIGGLSTQNLIPGPLGDTSKYSVQDEIKWNKVWSITDWDIQQHKLNFNKQGYLPKQALLDWPAHGDTNLGHAYYLAPFVDYNNDGKYNPYDGDYPKIKGQIAFYTIENINTIEDSVIFAFERHDMFYGYNCQQNEIKNTLFLQTRYINRTNYQLDSTYITAWTDMDLGCSTNDHSGCDPIRNTYYTYNGTPFDQDCNGAVGYGNYPPIQSVVILKGARVDNDNADNLFGVDLSQSQGVNGIGFGDGILDNEYWGMSSGVYYNIGGGNQGDPNSISDFYNYSRGKWRDGTPMTYGGTGYNTGKSICRYMFPNNSDTIYWYGTEGVKQNPPTWSEITEGNPAGDRRYLSSTGPFTLLPNGEMEVEMAFVTAIDSNASGLLGSLPLMEQYVDSLHSYYRRNKLPCGGNFTEVQEQNFVQQSFNVAAFPNPTKGTININYESELDATAKLYDMYGKLIVNSTIKEGISQLDIRQFSNGIYFLNITNTHHSKTIKVIKN